MKEYLLEFVNQQLDNFNDEVDLITDRIDNDEETRDDRNDLKYLDGVINGLLIVRRKLIGG